MSDDLPTTYPREWRKYLGLTQEQLGERMGKTGGQISEIETGKRQMDFPLLGQLSKALGVHWYHLLRKPADLDDLEMIVRRIPRESRSHAAKILETFAIPADVPERPKKRGRKFG